MNVDKIILLSFLMTAVGCTTGAPREDQPVARQTTQEQSLCLIEDVVVHLAPVELNVAPTPEDEKAILPAEVSKGAGSAGPLRLKTTAFPRGGQMLNAVYFARPGDSFKSVAMKIYGDMASLYHLRKANPDIPEIAAGDFVYYSSAVRKTDDARMLTYYEDSGITPKKCTLKRQASLKDVARALIGFAEAARELSALNNLGDVAPAGTEIRFYRSKAKVASKRK